MHDEMTHATAVAIERSRYNERHPTHLGILNDPGRIDREGTAGEVAFARAFGFDLDAVHAEGPTACNFVLSDGTRVDVRTSSAARFLFVPAEKLPGATVDAYVLARFSEKTGRATLVGWATREDVARAPSYVPTDRPDGMLAHAIDARALRGMDELRSRHGGGTQQASLF